MADSARPVGSKREKSPGVWEVSVSCGHRPDGRKRRKSRTVHGTESDADAALLRLADDMGAASALGAQTTLGDYFWGHFVPQRAKVCTRATVQFYESAFRTNIEQSFGSTPIDEITYDAVQRWVSSLPPQSAPHYVRALRAVMHQAAAERLISYDPMASRYRLPRRDESPAEVWGAQTVARAMSDLAGERIYPLWLIMVGAGLSESEALAIRREDVRFSGGMAYVDVCRAYTARDGMKAPKNARRYRTAVMGAPFAERLEYAIAGASGPIVAVTRGAHAGEPWGTRRAAIEWRKLFSDGHPLHGYPYVHLSRMRATYATLAQEAGVADSIINAMQGRAKNSQILYRHYEAPMVSAYKRAAESYAGLLGLQDDGRPDGRGRNPT